MTTIEKAVLLFAHCLIAAGLFTGIEALAQAGVLRGGQALFLLIGAWFMVSGLHAAVQRWLTRTGDLGGAR